MTRRVVAVLARPAREGLAPPGVDAAALAAAMTEDVVDLVSTMAEVEPALAVGAAHAVDVRELVWPGTPVCVMPDDAGVVDVLDRLASLGADEVAVVAGDAPDLPQLLLGKLHSALTGAQVAVCPADGGGLVAVAARVPLADWARDALSGLDDPEVLDALRRVAPPRGLSVGAGWHRIRTPYDVHRLDPQLEGWDATRALLSPG